MNNTKYDNSNIVVRKVTIDDNFEEIAELIYETGPYIYWFSDMWMRLRGFSIFNKARWFCI